MIAHTDSFDPTTIIALYERAWNTEMPKVKGVSESTVLLVLLAIIKHANPKRDHGELVVWPSVARLALLTRVSERQVQRVLSVFTASGPKDAVEPVAQPIMDVRHEGQRAGRGRPPRPAIYELHPERAPLRSVNGSDAGDASIGMVPTPAQNGADATGNETPMVSTPVSPELINSGENSKHEVINNARRRANYRESDRSTWGRGSNQRGPWDRTRSRSQVDPLSWVDPADRALLKQARRYY